MKKTLLYCLAFVFSLFIIFSSKSFATSIDDFQLFSDNRDPYDPVPGYRMYMSVHVTDPLGVPDNISTAKAIGLLDGDTYALNYYSELGRDYYHAQPYYTRQEGVYNAIIQNKQGDILILQSHNFDNTDPLAIPESIRATGPSTTPTITFNSVFEADKYQLKILDSSKKIIYASSSSTTPSFTVPQGVLQPGAKYYLSPRALDYDTSEPGAPLERRSVANIPVLTDQKLNLSPPKVYGLFVGVREGRGLPGLLDLNGNIMASLVQMAFDNKFRGSSNYGYSKLLEADSDSGQALHDYEIKNAITSITSNMRSGDSLYLYVASHGKRTDKTSLWLGGDKSDLTHWLDGSELTSYLNGIDINKWVFVDACHAGGMWDDGLKNLNHISFLAAADKDSEMHYDPNDGLPYFGKALGQALWNKQSLTFDDLLQIIRNENMYTNGTIGYEGELGDSVILNPDMWNPIGFVSSDFDDVIAVSQFSTPEPATLLLLGFGIIGLAGVRRFKK